MDGRTTEVVELTKTNSTPSFGKLPSYRRDAVGAMFGNAPIICGGSHSITEFDSCISYGDSQWSQSHSMKEKRQYSAGVQINSTTFWILGGDNGISSLDSTEFIIDGQTNGVSGPKLPYKLYKACAVKLSAQEIFVIGGEDDRENDRENDPNEVWTWIYNPQKGFERNQGPSLKIGRGLHSCSTMKDGDKSLIVVAGGNTYEASDSVEIYDPTNNTWQSGKTDSQTQKLLNFIIFKLE